MNLYYRTIVLSRYRTIVLLCCRTIMLSCYRIIVLSFQYIISYFIFHRISSALQLKSNRLFESIIHYQTKPFVGTDLQILQLSHRLLTVTLCNLIPNIASRRHLNLKTKKNTYFKRKSTSKPLKIWRSVFLCSRDT